ncbi:hypothetical protein [Rhodococcoides yunnanense]|uniref:hypothetical protein n=1 Tax=Rhodococcoides yunnanense TaxID=278209 RepID=UPI0009345C30|nr:hypothetical protein [Rhodococcus yunnanensis]
MSVSPRDVPRWVPITVPLTGALRWDWRESYSVFVAFAVPVLLWIHVPVLLPGAFFGLIALGAGIRIRRIASWWPLLRSGEVASVDSVERWTTGAGTVTLSHATGWRVHRGWFTGDITTSRVGYTAADRRGNLEIRGLPYTDGVILAHPTAPKAMCVSEFPFDLNDNENGRWSASVPPRFWAGAAATAAVYLLLVLGGVVSSGQLWF